MTMLEQHRKEQASMAREICLHRGEDPSSVNRYGIERWEKYQPLAGAVIREAERLFALRSTAAQAALPAQGEPVATEQIDAGAQALANDVWHPPRKLENMTGSEANKFRRQARIVLVAALSLVKP